MAHRDNNNFRDDSKDGTAKMAAKVRHWESLFPLEQRLYNDPYAYAMFPDSALQQWIGPEAINIVHHLVGLGGFNEMVSVRTRWLDDRITQIVSTPSRDDNESSARQLVILGAGYDTRAFRLDLWKCNKDFAVIEVDQPEVQERKLSILHELAKTHRNITERMNSKRVQFLSVDFNSNDDLQQRLEIQEGFKSNQRSIIALEGVTQYIPKESTADTLRKLRTIIAPGSTLLITYLDRKCIDEPNSLPVSLRIIRNVLDKVVGEPWISGWTKNEFEKFLNDCGYAVVSDTTVEDYNETYLKSAGRRLDEKELRTVERFVEARVV